MSVACMVNFVEKPPVDWKSVGEENRKPPKEEAAEEVSSVADVVIWAFVDVMEVVKIGLRELREANMVSDMDDEHVWLRAWGAWRRRRRSAGRKGCFIFLCGVWVRVACGGVPWRMGGCYKGGCCGL